MASGLTLRVSHAETRLPPTNDFMENQERPTALARPACYAASPALSQQSEHYPANFRGRVPKKIKMAKTLYPDEVCGISLAKPGTMLELNQVYDCWVNSHGAVAGYCDNGEKLGVKPGECDVVEWHDAKPHNV
jgi:hypothetical protein